MRAHNFIDLTGQRFGMLTVLSFCKIDETGHTTKWNCLCDCGKTKSINANAFKRGETQSCGCLHKKRTSEAKTTHGLTRDNKRLYGIWLHMKQRCYNINDISYSYYGGRGIKICEEWLLNNNLFFEWALTNGYKSNLSIDRIDNDGDYTPLNCRWSLFKPQMQNTTRTLGEKNVLKIRELLHIGLMVKDIAKQFGVHRTTISAIKKGLRYSNI